MQRRHVHFMPQKREKSLRGAEMHLIIIMQKGANKKVYYVIIRKSLIISCYHLSSWFSLLYQNHTKLIHEQTSFYSHNYSNNFFETLPQEILAQRLESTKCWDLYKNRIYLKCPEVRLTWKLISSTQILTKNFTRCF